MEGKEILFLVTSWSLESVNESKGILSFQFFVKACRSEVQRTDGLLLVFCGLLLLETQLMLDVVLTLHIGKGLEIPQLPNLLQFPFLDSVSVLFFFQSCRFLPISSLDVHVALYLLNAVVEDGPMLECIWDILPQTCEIGSVEGPMNGVLLLTMILKESRVELFVDDIAVFRRHEVNMSERLLCLLVVISWLSLHACSIYNERAMQLCYSAMR